MAPRREILDSEDEGSDFGDGAGFGDVDVPDEAEMPRDEPLEIVEASHNPGTDSTDPSFFQRIYDQQQAVAHAADLIPDTAPAGPPAATWTQISSAPPPAQKSQPTDHSSLTSITDPVPASRKSKRTHETVQSEVIDLTETPRKDAASLGSDVWDVPTSARSQRSTRTDGKRKLAQLSLEQESTPNAMPDTQDPYAFPDATPPAKRKVGRDRPPSSPQQPPDSSPVMLVPTEDATSSGRRTRSARKSKGSLEVESSMPDTAAPSLYITQSTLTASQKREYRTVSLSSEAVPEMLPPDQVFGAGEVYKSSGATTIAYPTPSRVASSRRLPEITEEMDGNVAETSVVMEADHQQSSPDVLTDMTTSVASRAKRSRIKIVSSAAGTSSELEPPASARRTKKRRVVREAEDDSWNRDPLGSTQENNEAPPRNTPDQDATGDADDREAQPEAPTHEAGPTEVEAFDAPNPPSNPPPKSKRGRKKKQATPKQPTPDLHEPSPEAPAPNPPAEPAEPAEPPTKRKRGRPRKADTPGTRPQAKPIVIADEPEQQQPQPLPGDDASHHPPPLSETSSNSQHSRAADSVPFVTGVDEGKENDRLEVAAAKDDALGGKMEGKGGGKEKRQPAVKDGKAGGGAGQKVQYRVGLSKRSRIAPLLKCLKK